MLVTAPALRPHRQYQQAENKTGRKKKPPLKKSGDTDDRVTALTTHTGKRISVFMLLTLKSFETVFLFKKSQWTQPFCSEGFAVVKGPSRLCGRNN